MCFFATLYLFVGNLVKAVTEIIDFSEVLWSFLFSSVGVKIHKWKHDNTKKVIEGYAMDLKTCIYLTMIACMVVHAAIKIFFFFFRVNRTRRTENIQKRQPTKKKISFRLMFTFSREPWSQAARVLFNSLYILARSCSALYYNMRPLLKIWFKWMLHNFAPNRKWRFS
jgi:hypothetical protein